MTSDAGFLGRVYAMVSTAAYRSLNGLTDVWVHMLRIRRNKQIWEIKKASDAHVLDIEEAIRKVQYEFGVGAISTETLRVSLEQVWRTWKQAQV